MKPLPLYAVFVAGPAKLIISGCSEEPSQTDIWTMFEAKGNEIGCVVLHQATKHGCKDSGEPQKGRKYYCDFDVDAPTSSFGRQRETLAIEVSRAERALGSHECVEENFRA